MSDNLEKEIKSLVAKVLKMPEEKIKPETKLFADLGVDSLLGVEIFAALDKRYRIDVPESKLREVQTLNDIVKIVEEMTK